MKARIARKIIKSTLILTKKRKYQEHKAAIKILRKGKKQICNITNHDFKYRKSLRYVSAYILAGILFDEDNFLDKMRWFRSYLYKISDLH